MAARIRSLRNGITPVDEASRDDLVVGDVVTVSSLDPATKYNWTLVFTPEDLAGNPSAAAFTGSSTAVSPGTFTVDHVGSYLVRLIVDAGLPTENAQYVRLRALTATLGLTLVAAGERRDATGVIPVDADPEGWANDQNRNLLALEAAISAGAPPLSTVLGVGNTTGGTDVVLTSGDVLLGESGAGVAGNVTLRAGTDTGAGPANGGDVVLRPGGGVGGGTDGSIVLRNATATNGVRLNVTGVQELTIGTTFPMVYSGTTGKLTVPGVIDPTALILSDPAAGTNIYLESADGQTAAVSPANRGRLRYNDATGQWEQSVNGGAYGPLGGGEDLATTLGVGNDTGGTDITLTSGDAIVGESSAGVAGNAVLRGGTDTGAGPTNGGDVVLRPGEGVGLGNDGEVVIQSADGLTSVRLASTGAEELTVGTTFQLIYDGTTGKLTVPGVLDPTALVLSDPAAGTDLYIESGDGQTSAVAPAGKGRIRYNDATGQWEQSVNGGAYTTIGGGGGGGGGILEYHQDFPAAPGSTVQYRGWVPIAADLQAIRVYMDVVNTVGTFTMTVTNETTGNPCVLGAVFDMNTLVATNVTSVPLTLVPADLSFVAQGRWTISLTSNNPGFNGSGIYVELEFAHGSAGLSGQDLSATLGIGNATGGFNVVLSSGDAVIGEAGFALGGNAVLRGGTPTGGVSAGGSVIIRPGEGAGGGTDGDVVIQSADGTTSVRLKSTSDYGLARGYQALTETYGEDSLASGQFTSVGDARSSVVVLRASTSAIGTFNLYSDGAASPFVMVDGAFVKFTVQVVGKDTVANTVSGWDITGAARQVGGVLTIIGQTLTPVPGNEVAASVSVAAVGSDLTVAVTTNSANTSRWVATMSIAYVR